MTNTVPTPKHPGHPALRNGRYHVYLSSPIASKFQPGKTAQRVHTEGRFVTEKAARTWAEASRKPGDRAQITHYSPVDGWQAHAWATLTDEGWK